jgi:23S rRNA pseudouridine2605 synthase
VWVDLSESDIKALRLMTGVPPQRGDGRNDGGRQESRGQAGSGRPPQQPQTQGKRGLQGPQDRPPREQRQDAPRGPTASQKPSRNPRPPRQPLGDELPRDFREPGDPARIPNPLQQTYDKRAILNDRPPRRDDDDEDGPIPNPLQQTYDRRFVQNAPGFSGPRTGRAGKPAKGGAPKQPDPMQTAVGYIGADAFTRKMQNQGGRGGGKGGKRRGGR